MFYTFIYRILRLLLQQSHSGGLPLWSWLKYLNSYWIDCNDILYRYLWSPRDEAHTLNWSPALHCSTFMRTFVVFKWGVLLICRLIGMKLSSDIHLPPWDNFIWRSPNFLYSTNNRFNLSSFLVCDQSNDIPIRFSCNLPLALIRKH